MQLEPSETQEKMHARGTLYFFAKGCKKQNKPQWHPDVLRAFVMAAWQAAFHIWNHNFQNQSFRDSTVKLIGFACICWSRESKVPMESRPLATTWPEMLQTCFTSFPIQRNHKRRESHHASLMPHSLWTTPRRSLLQSLLKACRLHVEDLEHARIASKPLSLWTCFDCLWQVLE